jgi:hypothetical protein
MTISHVWQINGNSVTVATTVSDITSTVYVTRTVHAAVAPDSHKESQTDGVALAFNAPGGTQSGNSFVYSDNVQGIIGVDVQT